MSEMWRLKQKFRSECKPELLKEAGKNLEVKKEHILIYKKALVEKIFVIIYFFIDADDVFCIEDFYRNFFQKLFLKWPKRRGTKTIIKVAV